MRFKIVSRKAWPLIHLDETIANFKKQSIKKIDNETNNLRQNSIPSRVCISVFFFYFVVHPNISNLSLCEHLIEFGNPLCKQNKYMLCYKQF